jgi:hypothetical protein
LAGIRAGESTLATFPETWHFQWCVRKSRSFEKLRSPYRCGGSADSGNAMWRIPFCFPFNCAEMNIGTGTNGADCKQPRCPTLQSITPLQRCTMSKIEELADRVERLLLRHEELQRTAVLLEQQLASVSHERDSLRSRLNAARNRIDALLERLPNEPAVVAAVATSPDTDNAPAGTAP